MKLDLGIGLRFLDLRCGPVCDFKGSIHSHIGRLVDLLQMWFWARYAVTGTSYRNPMINTLIRRLHMGDYTVSKERADRCVSHHHACDCREYRFQQLEDKNKLLMYLLGKAKKYVEDDVLMVATISRHAPLPPEAQAAHDSTESESEKLLPLINQALENTDG